MIVKSNIIEVDIALHVCYQQWHTFACLDTCMHFDVIHENQVDTLTLVLKILEYLKRFSKEKSSRFRDGWMNEAWADKVHKQGEHIPKHCYISHILPT